MKIWITGAALRGSNENQPFREGTLRALIGLDTHKHPFGCDSNGLSPIQQALLEQESLRPAELDKKSCDLIVDAQDRKLVALDHDLEVLADSEGWDGIVRFILGRQRIAERHRKTRETDISVRVNLDGTGENRIETGLGFFDHMLEQIARHGFIDLDISCKGDLHIDEHHTIEDVAIALGECLHEAFGDKKGIERYGFVLPMDEAQATVALDLSGRPWLEFEGGFRREKVGDFPTEMTRHFFHSLATGMKATLQIRFKGENDHHNIEAIFKGFARTLKQAAEGNARAPESIPSSKGIL